MNPTTIPLPAQRSLLRQLTATTVLLAILATGASQVRAQAAAPGQPQPAAMAMPHGAQHAAHRQMGAGMGMGMAGPMIPERALDAVGASAEQKTRLREIFKAAGDDLRAQREAGRPLQAQLLALMAAPQVDAAAAEALRQKQLAVHDAVTKRSLQAMLDAQAVLTPEQRRQLAERMAQRQQRMDHHHRRQAPEAPKG
jgi:Spy/CpxP family protein refolding chaperone